MTPFPWLRWTKRLLRLCVVLDAMGAGALGMCACGGSRGGFPLVMHRLTQCCTFAS